MKTLYYGGKILTMAEPLYAEAMLTEGDRILAAGERARLESLADAKVDLQGKTVLPGFIDPHSHFFQVAAALLQVSLNEADSPEEIRRRIAAFVKAHKVSHGQWLCARDYDNNRMPGLQNPTLEELDSFAPHNPLVIHHKSGHMGLFNSQAMEILGLTPETPCPEGGKIEVRDGKLTGYLEENAFFGVLSQIPMADASQLLDAFRGAQEKYASYGITTLQDGMVAEQMLPMYELLLRENMLYLDVILYSGLDAWPVTEAVLARHPEQKHLKSGGMKIFLDGSPQGRTAWMRKPYADSKDYCGYGTMTDEAVEKAFGRAAENSAQLIAHCNGDGAAEQFLRCLKKAEKKYPQLRNLRPVIIHGQLMGTDQIPRAKELGAMISFFIAHIYHWGDVHLRNFGAERANNISAAGTALREEVNFTFHQDAPVIEPDMLETVWCAVNRTTREGRVLGENQKLSVLDALKAVTVNGAYQYFLEKDRGSLEAGKRADFIFLSEDPLEADPQKLRDIRVLATYKDGKCVYTAK